MVDEVDENEINDEVDILTWYIQKYKGKVSKEDIEWLIELLLGVEL